tara:strand:+ start:384 stop:662 length:279 start_codon:yes stop_codon:yes gene_type:complete
MKLNKKSIPVGSFIHKVIPAENKMTIVSNSATHVSGVYSYKKENDIARIIVLLIEIADILKVFTVAFEAKGNGSHLHMCWGHFSVALPFIKN